MPGRTDIRDTDRRWTDRVTASHDPQSADARAFARGLRIDMTAAEAALWSALRDGQRGVKFRRQHPLGKYVADFYCHRARLVVELDGDAHEEREHKDVARDEWMKQRGLAVVRFHNEAVIRERLVVVESIERWLKRRLNEFGMHSKDEGKKSSKMK